MLLLSDCAGTIPCKTCAIDNAAMCTSCEDGSFVDTANSNVCTGMLQLHNYPRHLYNYTDVLFCLSLLMC